MSSESSSNPDLSQGALHDARRQAMEQSRAAADEARHAAGQARDRLREKTRAAADQARQRAAEVGQTLRQRGVGYVDQQKQRAADEVSHLSEAVRSAADRLHEQDDENVAAYVESLAEQIDRASTYLRDRDATEMFEDLQGFARRRPEIVMGAMFIAGLGIARLLKASSQRRDDSGDDGYGYDESGLEHEAALDADARSVGSHLPPGPAPGGRPFEAGGYTADSISNPAGAPRDVPPGSAPSSAYNPSAGSSSAEGDSPSGWGSVTP